MRSKLFVPGVRPELFDKAMASAADALSFDLEDAVPASQKAGARACVVEYLASRPHRATGKQIIVRANGPDTPEWADDLRALVSLDVDLVNLPKIESAEQLVRAVRQMEAIESESPRAVRPGLLVNIETPLALRHAAAIARAHPRVRGLQLGLGDLLEPYGIARDDLRNVHAMQYALRMAAAEAGVFACDTAFPGLDDEDGFRAEAESARALGYAGKSCVHPRQVAWANDVFTPTPEEIEKARHVVEAAEQAERRGHGAFAADGRMVDAPYLARAQAVLAMVQSNQEKDSA